MSKILKKGVFILILYFIRHGDPIYSPDSLTPLGQRQAEAVGKRLATHGIDEIFASTSTRAKHTATPLSQICKKPITELDWCNESHAWAEFTCKNEDGRFWLFGVEKMRKIMNSPEIRALGNEWYTHPAFEKCTADGAKRIAAAADEWLLSLGYKHNRDSCDYTAVTPNDKRIALFAHQGFGIAFLSSILDIPYPEFSMRFDIQHSGVTVIYFKNGGDGIIPQVLQLSNDSHLYAEGLPTKYNNGFYI